MTDVPAYVAIVTAGTSVVASAVPLLIGWARDGGQVKRAEAEKLASEQREVARSRRELCVSLLSLARHFRVLMENVYGPGGALPDTNADQVGTSVANIASQADQVEFNVPKAGPVAVSLANEARKLASIAEDKKREHGESLVSSDFTKFDDSLETFKNSALSALEELERHPE
jgi:hypothetical protein